MTDRLFRIVLEGFVSTGRAPEYEDIGAQLGISASEAKKAVRKLVSPMGFPGWMDGDEIGTFPPFSNTPTPHAITVDGEEKGYGQ